MPASITRSSRSSRSAEPLLEARSIRYDVDSIPILRGVDLSIADGEVVALVGPNGSGKTTLLNILQHATIPTAGEVRLRGRPVRRFSARERARLIATMDQHGSGDVPLSVGELVLLGRIPHRGAWGGRTEADLDRARDALEAVGALELAQRSISSLSGGERQRVLIARALAQEPRVLLMDEPTNHLDIATQHAVLRVVRAQAVSTILVLHDLNLASRYCDRVLVLSDGAVASDGPPGGVLTDELVRRVYGVAAERHTAEDGPTQLLFRPLP